MKTFPAASIWPCLGLLLLGAVGGVSGVGAAAPAPQTASTIEELALALSTLFPGVDGTVVTVEDDRMEVDRGAAQGLRPALALAVYRAGEPFRHPLTGVPIASSETPLGRAIVERVESERAMVRLLAEPTAPPVRVGDRVRLTSGPIPVALATASSGSPPIAGRFLAALEETGRFQAKSLVFSAPAPSLIGEATALPEAAAWSFSPPSSLLVALAPDARAQGADYLFLFDLRLRKGIILGAVAVVETTTGRLVDAVQAPLQLRADELPGETADPLLQLLASRDGRAFREVRFAHRAEQAVIGDLDQDGQDELVVSDGSRLRVYRMNALSPTLLAEEPSDRPGRRHLALDVADIHALGRPQLFVTAMVDDRLDSYVLIWRDGALQRVVEHQPYYFRVLTPPGRPPLLLAQHRSLSSPFYGDVVRLAWTGRAYDEREALALPPSVAIYDVAMADFDRDGRDDLLYLDQQDILVLVSADGRRLGASRESFGGVASFIEYLPAGINQGSGQLPARARLLGRMLVVDLDGDGSVEVIVPKNVPLTKRIERIKGYRYGQIYALGWDGRQFVQKWVIPRVEGVIADIAVAQWLGRDAGPQVLVLANSTFKDKIMKDFFAKSSYLWLYAVPQG